MSKGDTFDNEALRAIKLFLKKKKKHYNKIKSKLGNLKYKSEQYGEIPIWWHFESIPRAWNFSNQTSRVLLKLSKNFRI